jgi:signal transduction histidine kinase
MPTNDADTDPLVSYRLGAVRAGLQATVLALLVLVLFRLLPGHGEISNVAYVFVLVSAAIGALGVSRLPWARLFRSGLGVKALYAWSVLDILLITVAVGFTGGGRSEMFLLYALTTFFFWAAYPPRGQVALLLFTFTCYLGVLGVTGWEIGAAVVFVRCGMLAIVALLVSYLAAELLRHIASQQEDRYRAERWAGLLSTVAASARRMTLDRDTVLTGLVDSVIGLGFDGGAVCSFDQENVLFVLMHPKGLPEHYVQRVHPATADVPGMVRRGGGTAIVDEAHPPEEGFTAPLMEAGFSGLIASPVWVDGWLSGALLGARRDRREISPPEAEAFELLAAQAGLAMENAQRFEETLHTVERLEDLDRLKDDFLATASHEIRTPLTVILGSGLTLEQRWNDLDDPIRFELLQAMNRNGRALESLIASLLDFARLGAEGQNVTRQPTDLRPLVEEVAGRLRRLFEERPLEVAVEDGLVVEADAVLLERVVENLLSNASKHTTPGTHVRVSAHSEHGFALVSVSDDGPGIPEEEAVHLGERFYRGGDLNDRTKGIGLGLAFSREILELHGSALEIRTQPGAGSTFAFRLPLAGVEAQPFASAMLSISGSERSQTTAGTETE